VDVYALPPEEFTAARTAAAKAAKAAGDAAAAKQIAAQRRPSASAWLVNRLVRQSPELLEQLLALGPALAAAQSAGSADDLRELGRQRRELVAAVTDQAVGDAGRPVTAAVRSEVEQTLEAALADPLSAEAVRSGRLVRALSFAGFGGVELDGAVAEPLARPASSARGARRDTDGAQDRAAAALAAAEAAALQAAGALDDAVGLCERAQQNRVEAEQRADDARAEVQRLQAALAVATADHERAAAGAADAGAAADDAVRVVAQAQQAAEQARAALDALRRR
jgi:hypothetical protein